MNFAHAFSRFLCGMFFALIRPYLNFRVGPIWIRGLDQAREQLRGDLPLVLFANHTSWYDAFLLIRLVRLLKRRFIPSFPMAAHEYSRRPYAWLLGAVPMSSNPRTTMLALKRFRALRTKYGADLAIVYFPQGRIDAGMVSPLVFQKGLEVLLDRLAPIQTIAVAIQFEMMQAPRPQVFLSMGTTNHQPLSTEEMRAEVDKLRMQTRRELDSLGEDFAVKHGEGWQLWRW